MQLIVVHAVVWLIGNVDNMDDDNEVIVWVCGSCLSKKAWKVWPHDECHDDKCACNCAGDAMKQFDELLHDDKIRAESLASAWMDKHTAHVRRLVKETGGFDAGSYPPYGSDCFRPELWKAGHWRWFLSGRSMEMK